MKRINSRRYTIPLTRLVIIKPAKIILKNQKISSTIPTARASLKINHKIAIIMTLSYWCDETTILSSDCLLGSSILNLSLFFFKPSSHPLYQSKAIPLHFSPLYGLEVLGIPIANERSPISNGTHISFVNLR